MIRNLGNQQLEELTEYIIEQHWKRGSISPEWKHSEITTIPKSGKELEINNLRPISLTSCVGKLYERIITGAFDNVSHEAILEALNNIGSGERIYNFVKAFISNRTATIGLGNMRSDCFQMPNRGIPQGSVISPLLCNITMIKIAQAVTQFTDIGHVMYADDITLWVTKGNQQKMEQLQAATNAVVEKGRENGLACSPEKCELI